MGEQIDIESLSLTERIVLLGITDAVEQDEDPVASLDVKAQCEPLLNHVDADFVSNPGEPDVARSLSVLGTKPYVSEDRSNTSPAGKGRPKYSLHTDTDPVLDALEDDDRLQDAVEFVRNA